MENKEKSDKTSKENLITNKLRENPWILSTIVFGVLAFILLSSSLNATGNAISEKDAGEYLINYFESQGVNGLELNSITQENNFYKINITYQEQTIPFYVTKTGFLTGNSIVSLIEEPEEINSEDTNAQTQEIPKSDKPIVELFIMTHCPYGTQAEKGILSTIETLGNNIDAKIRFVHYFMHEPEETETPIQVCIREEQPDKFYEYLTCFLEDGDSDRCLLETGIDKTALATCVEGNAENYYAEDSELSESYGVQGSPSLVINNIKISSQDTTGDGRADSYVFNDEIIPFGRDSNTYKQIICSLFNTEPSECSTELSSTSPSPGFGWEEGEDTGGQC